MATTEAWFQVIKSEIKNQIDHQIGMDHRLMQLEDKAATIDDNTVVMMVHWRINPSQKCRQMMNCRIHLSIW
jgi:hypothetical protein